MSKQALVIIDLQNDYFAGGKWALHNISQAAANARQVLDAARRQGIPVIHVRHEFPTDEAPFFAPGSTGAEIHKDLTPAADEPVVLKHKANAFLGTDLKALLDQRGVTDLTFVGAMSHMCIDAATRAAADFGYQVTVIEDACACRDLEFGDKVVPAEQVHTAYMSALSFAYATVTSTVRYLES
ncbi:MAG: cysteine hydrolase [Marinobacterium sp.]|nr:cysteine hydrolase [Marinobacterium sp.]